MIDYVKVGIVEARTGKVSRDDVLSGAGIAPAVEAGVIMELKNGDHKSFEIVFHKFYYRVRNFLLSLTKDSELAEELAQDVFVSLWEKRESLKPEKSFNSYIYVIARNAALSHFRTMSIHRHIEKQVLDYEPVASTESDIFAREARLLVELTVGRMPKQRKKIYELSHVHNKSNNEIAEELNITKKAVEKHLRLAASDIRSVLQRFISIFIGF